MSRAFRLGVAASATVMLLAAPSGEARSGAAPDLGIARIVVATPVRTRPTSGSALRARIAAVRPITSQQTSLPVVRERRDQNGDSWLLVRLPGRPNGSLGWIQARAVHRVAAPWRVVVDRASRRASVYRNGALRFRFPVVVGAPATPTPRGRFFIAEHVPQSPGSSLGPWALATSAYSHVLQEFDGGPGQIALHGRSGALLADQLGTARSHGCIRFDNAVIRMLAGLLPNGTPVDVI